MMPESSFPAPDAGPTSPAGAVPPGPDDADLKIDFLQMVQRPPQRLSLRQAARGNPEGQAPSKEPHGTRVPIERKTGGGTRPFTRLMTRPETTVAATTAAEQPHAERVNYGNLPPSGASFGKLRTDEEVTYTPNRLHGVMNDAWTHSPLKWMDHLGKIGPVLGFLLIAGIMIGLFQSFGGELQRQRGNYQTGSASTPPPSPVAVRQASIRRTFEAFLAAPDISGKLPWVLEAKRVAGRMTDYYVTRGEKDPAVASFEVGSPVWAAGEWWFTVTLAAPDGTRSTIPIKETPEGGQLDWENFVAYGSMPWDKFETARPTDPQSMRVRIRPSSHYAGKYAKEEFSAYEIRPRSGSAVLHGYVLRSSRAAQGLAELPPGASWHPANLYLRWDPGAGVKDSVVIVEVIRNNWLDAVPDNQAVPVPPAP